jgi:hypothetical protein
LLRKLIFEPRAFAGAKGKLNEMCGLCGATEVMPCYKATARNVSASCNVMPEKGTCAGEDTRTTAGQETGGTLRGFIDPWVGFAGE